MVFFMNNEVLQILSFGSFFVFHFHVKTKNMPSQSFAPPGDKIFLHFRPILSPHIFGLKSLRLLKLGVFTDIFPLILDMVLTF